MSFAAVWYFVRKFWKPLAVLGLVIAVYGSGYQRAKKACNAANLKAEITELKRQAKANKTVLQNAAKQDVADLREIQTLTKKVEDYEIDIGKRHENTGCILSDDDAARLRAIK